MPAAASRIVTLTTDFGLDDGYVAQLHGILLSVSPSLRIVDLSHAVPHSDAADALTTSLFLTESAWPRFPAGTVHVVVVDPGVGSARGLVAIETPRAWLVGPDTGVLSSGLPDAVRPLTGIERAELPIGYRARDIRSTPLAGDPVSGTFHGRDLMAPVAGALALGAALESTGPSVRDVAVAATLASPILEGAGMGRILHVDRFGNAITSLRAEAAGEPFEIVVAGQVVSGPASSYANAGAEIVALPSSSGYLEIALANASAAAALGIERGTPVLLRRREA